MTQLAHARAKRNLIVTNTPNPVTDVTADLAVFLLLDVLQQLSAPHLFFLSLHAGEF